MERLEAASQEPPMILAPTTDRHAEILSEISFAFRPMARKGLIWESREQIGLVVNKNELIDLGLLNGKQLEMLHSNMNKLKCNYPDYMVFQEDPNSKSKKKLFNKKRTRVAGIPDLIIEVWSSQNSALDREEKKKLYAKESNEFWEIVQDNPTITCWKGLNHVYEQRIEEPVTTPWGEVIDLSYLAKGIDYELISKNSVDGIDIDL